MAGHADAARRTSGVLLVHACPRALAPHLEWALASVFDAPVRPEWQDQPLLPAHLRAELGWHGAAGTAARIASALLPLTGLRFEVSADPADGRPGERFAVTPSLGLFRAETGEHGDLMLHEDRIRAVLHSVGDADDVVVGLHRLLGTPWDEELEPFRVTHEGGGVRLLHHVG